MKLIISIATILVILSCKHSENDNEVQQLYDNVMKIHDDVMPEISTINKLSRKIRKVETQNDKTADLLTKLEKADDGMMDWMSDFQVYKSYKDSAKTAKLRYLNEELVRIQKVSDDMTNSISEAKIFLNEK